MRIHRQGESRRRLGHRNREAQAIVVGLDVFLKVLVEFDLARRDQHVTQGRAIGGFDAQALAVQVVARRHIEAHFDRAIVFGLRAEAKRLLGL